MEGPLEEGICQVIAYEWLNWIEAESSSSGSGGGGGGGGEFVKKLIKSYKRDIETEACEEYGDGFRNVKAAVDRHGLQTIVGYISLYKCLPPGF